MIYCYYYDETTKEYKDCDTAPLNPVASKREGKEVYSLPYCSTFTKPPKINKFKAALYNKETDNWNIVDDFRNEYIVNADMNLRIMKEIGALPVGYIHITEKQAQTIEADTLYYIIKDGKLIKNPDYEEALRQQEAAKIPHLKLSKYDFFQYVLKPKEITYSMLMDKVNSDDDLAAAWNLSTHITRSDDFIKDIIPDITDAELDDIFKTYGI